MSQRTPRINRKTEVGSYSGTSETSGIGSLARDENAVIPAEIYDLVERIPNPQNTIASRYKDSDSQLTYYLNELTRTIVVFISGPLGLISRAIEKIIQKYSRTAFKICMLVF